MKDLGITILPTRKPVASTRLIQCLFILALLLALSSCAQSRWYKSGATVADYNRDAYECERDSLMVPVGYDGVLGDALKRYQMRERCMGARGWVREIAR